MNSLKERSANESAMVALCHGWKTHMRHGGAVEALAGAVSTLVTDRMSIASHTLQHLKSLRLQLNRKSYLPMAVMEQASA